VLGACHAPIRPHAYAFCSNLHIFRYSYFLRSPIVQFELNFILMNLEEDVEVVCPYCGAIFTTFVDTSAGGYAAIEDCQVCCRPIELIVGCHAGVIDQVETARA
jgi:Cysteine-rich CPXCG